MELQGYKVEGELSRTPQYKLFKNNALDGLSPWKISDGELYLLNNIIIKD